MIRIDNTFRVGLLGAALLAGCGDSCETNKISDWHDVGQSFAADSIETKIRKIATYTLFDGSALNYGQLAEVTGIESKFPGDYPFVIEVLPNGRKIEQYVVGKPEDRTGHVRIDIPYNLASGVHSSLIKMRNERLGLEPWIPTEEEIKNLPPGDY